MIHLPAGLSSFQIKQSMMSKYWNIIQHEAEVENDPINFFNDLSLE